MEEGGDEMPIMTVRCPNCGARVNRTLRASEVPDAKSSAPVAELACPRCKGPFSVEASALTERVREDARELRDFEHKMGSSEDDYRELLRGTKEDAVEAALQLADQAFVRARKSLDEIKLERPAHAIDAEQLLEQYWVPDVERMSLVEDRKPKRQRKPVSPVAAAAAGVVAAAAVKHASSVEQKKAQDVKRDAQDTVASAKHVATARAPKTEPERATQSSRASGSTGQSATKAALFATFKSIVGLATGDTQGFDDDAVRASNAPKEASGKKAASPAAPSPTAPHAEPVTTDARLQQRATPPKPANAPAHTPKPANVSAPKAAQLKPETPPAPRQASPAPQRASQPAQRQTAASVQPRGAHLRTSKTTSQPAAPVAAQAKPAPAARPQRSGAGTSSLMSALNAAMKQKAGGRN